MNMGGQYKKVKPSARAKQSKTVQTASTGPLTTSRKSAVQEE